jgi:hypothetical protein
MDTTEKILKLVALGWDGKENELDFFQRVYGLRAEIIQKEDMMEVVLSYGNQRRKTTQHRIRFKKKNVDLVRYCLRLFRTKNGEPEGPNSAFFVSEDQEWT